MSQQKNAGFQKAAIIFFGALVLLFLLIVIIEVKIPFPDKTAMVTDNKNNNPYAVKKKKKMAVF